MGRFTVPEAVQTLGLPVYDPNDADFPRKTTPDPVQINHPAFRKPTLQDHVLYNEKPSLVLDGTDAEPMSAGLAQAGALLNAVIRKGFPDRLLKAASGVGDLPKHSDRLCDAIMHAERYDPTLEKLPRRHDPVLFWVVHPRMHGTPRIARNNILLDNLFRYSSVALKAQLSNANPQLAQLFEDFRIDRDEPLSSILPNGCSSEQHGVKDLVVRSHPHLTIQSSKVFSPWASSEEVEATAKEIVPDIRPIDPTIDLKSDHIYNREAVLARSWIPLHVHSIMWSREQDQKYPWTKEQLAANAIAHCFGAAVAQATRYGEVVDGRLKRPIVTRAVQLVDGRLDLVAFQLNTVDLNNRNSVKNIAWIEPAQQLYKPGPIWENYEKVVDLNESAFVKFFATLLG
uniref:Large ribosomal subunit protein mL37 n=1 Tax=Plectus sambesii TaxID=2011161 RepID=A0A914VYE1_9BILA